MEKGLVITSTPAKWITLLVGAIPIILAVITFLVLKTSTPYQDAAWIDYLERNQDEFAQPLIISSVTVTVFCALLRRKEIIFTYTSRNVFSNGFLAAITLFPLTAFGLILHKQIERQKRIKNKNNKTD